MSRFRAAVANPRFKDKLLRSHKAARCHVLDPRYPDVRQYLVSTYERFLIDFGIDGFKLDFIDVFNLREDNEDETDSRRDYHSVPPAVNRLLTDIVERLMALKPDILIEFRQRYIGPLMRQFGNMFRALDVPNDFPGNRVRTIDVRLLAGNTPVHSDMFMWHKDDSVQSAAMQLVHTLFAVPQVSVLLDQIPADHLEMLRFYLDFWKKNQDVLLDGELMPSDPGMLYPSVSTRTNEKLLAVWYSKQSVSLIGSLPKVLILVNGTFNDHVVVDLEISLGTREMTVLSCTGKKIIQTHVNLDAGVHKIHMPPAGVSLLIDSD